MSFEFKQVDIGEEGKNARRITKWKHIGKTLLYMVTGVLISLAISYLSEGNNLTADEIKNGVFFGAFIGFSLTNSPCARGRC